MQNRVNVFFTFLIFSFLSVLVFFLAKTSFFASIENTFKHVFLPFEQSFLRVAFIPQNLFYPSERKVFEEEKQILLKEVVDQKNLERENKALRDQFQSVVPSHQDLLPATVVGAPSFIPGISLPEYFLLDKGTKDGVRIGQAVVYKDNLVGRITASSFHLAKVMVVTNGSFSVTARAVALKEEAVESFALGVVKGQGNGGMILNNISLSDTIKVSDIVVTYGNVDEKGHFFPPHLIVGTIVSIDKKPSALFQVAKVKSILDFARLTTVFIVVGERKE